MSQTNKLNRIQLYKQCIAIKNQLDLELQSLSRLASKIYGEELEANICGGEEIEFRKLGDDGNVDANSTILLEEIVFLIDNHKAIWKHEKNK